MLRCYAVRMSNAEEMSKFADALPSEWNETLIELKKDYSFSRFTLNDFVNKLQEFKLCAQIVKNQNMKMSNC
ncbi:hypothetical protein Hanom_Chr17g01581431 [Helianthus anomalus]